MSSCANILRQPGSMFCSPDKVLCLQPDLQLGWHEINPDSTVKYSAGYMQDIWRAVVSPSPPGDGKPPAESEQQPEASKPLTDDDIRKLCQKVGVTTSCC